MSFIWKNFKDHPELDLSCVHKKTLQIVFVKRPFKPLLTFTWVLLALNLIYFPRCKFLLHNFYELRDKTPSKGWWKQIEVINFWRCALYSNENNNHFEGLKIKVSKGIVDTATSILVTDVGDEMYWWQLWDSGDLFKNLRVILISIVLDLSW